MSVLKTCYVYIIADRELEGPVKIGITTNLDARLASIQTGSHRELCIAFSFATPDKAIAAVMEEAFHQECSSRRLAGEWFDMDAYGALVKLTALFESAFAHFMPDDKEAQALAAEHSGLNLAKTMISGINAIAKGRGLVRKAGD